MIRTISIVEDDCVSEKLEEIVQSTSELDAKILELQGLECNYKTQVQSKISNADGIVVIPINTDEETNVSIKFA